jgi:hypothetical protein
MGGDEILGMLASCIIHVVAGRLRKLIDLLRIYITPALVVSSTHMLYVAALLACRYACVSLLTPI